VKCHCGKNAAVPSKLRIYKLVAKSCAAGSVLDKKKTKKKHSLAEEKIVQDSCLFRSQS
jgi:hypothetical protein